MFIKLFLRYLRPHKARIALGLLCMLIVAFLGTYNILLLKPVLDVLFNQVEYQEREADVDEDILDRQEKIAQVERELEKSNGLGKRLEFRFKETAYPLRNALETRIFGSSFYVRGELVHLPVLLDFVKTPQTPFAQYLFDHLRESTKSALAEWEPQSPVPVPLEDLFIEDLNRVLADPLLYQKLQLNDSSALSEKTRAILQNREIKASDAQLNRAILSDLNPQAFEAERPLALYRYASENKTKTIRLIVAFLLLIYLIKGFVEYVYDYSMTYSLMSATTEMKSDMFRHMISQDMRYLSSKPVGFLMSRVTSDVGVLQQTTKMLIKNGLMQSLRLAFLLSLLLFLNVQMTLVVFLLVLPSLVILSYFAKKLKKVSAKGKKRGDILSSAMNESFGNMRLVKALSSEDLEYERFHKHNQKMFYYHMKMRVAKFATSPIIEFLGVMGISVILMWGGWAVYRSEKPMEPGAFLTYLIALALFYSPLRQLSRMNLNWQQGKVSGERVQEILDIRSTITDPPAGSAIAELEHVSLGIRVKNLSFAYEDKSVLRDLNVDFPAGKTTAIVGRSGSGKTTLGNLLLRLYDPDEGSIEIDGHDLRSFRLKDLRSHFGIVTQETILFNDTVANNIAYGTAKIQDIDMQRVERAARAANAHDFILSLDGGKGYHSSVGPGGSALSGGQRQRIAIARAFYRDPEILLLDEATSSLDTESEGAVQQAIESLMHRRTVIIIAHRLTTIQHADNILVLDDGRLVEQGTHAQLIQTAGPYATLYRLGEFAEE